MILTELFTVPLATSLVAALFLGGVAVAQPEVSTTPESTEAVATGSVSDETSKEESSSPSTGDFESTEDATAAVDGDVQSATEDEAAERRKELVQDAVEALEETRKALKALDDGDTEAALESLAVANGKLDLVVARNPRMALAPVDVRLITHDLFATKDSIERARKQAVKHLKDGRVQDARALIEGLRSDVVIEVMNLPLATYPAAIRAITPMIDEGEVERAKTALSRALGTLVVTEYVHPLPVLRAEHMLTRAEELAEMDERSDEQSDELTRMLDGARTQLEMAEALGYGKEGDFGRLYEQLDQISERTSGGKSGTGFFDRIRSLLRSFGRSGSSAT